MRYGFSKTTKSVIIAITSLKAPMPRRRSVANCNGMKLICHRIFKAHLIITIPGAERLALEQFDPDWFTSQHTGISAYWPKEYEKVEFGDASAGQIPEFVHLIFIFSSFLIILSVQAESQLY